MSFMWLIILLIYGCINGFNTIPALAWLMLAPMMYQDAFDNRLEDKVNVKCR